MKKTTPIDAQSQLKNSLKQLHKLGLYDPKHPRRQPTKYAKTLVKRFTALGVLGDKPKASAIKIPKSAVSNVGGEFVTKRTAKGAVAIVPNRAGVKSFYSKKSGGIAQKFGSYKFERYHDSRILLRGGWPDDLKKGERIAVPKGNGFKILKSQDEVNAEMGKYKPDDVNVHFWQYPYIVTRR